MIRQPPRFTLFPHTTLSRSPMAFARSEGPTAGSIPRQGTPWLRKFLSQDRKSTRLNSSHANISYAVFCLKKKKKTATSSRTEEDKKEKQVEHVRQASTGKSS